MLSLITQKEYEAMLTYLKYVLRKERYEDLVSAFNAINEGEKGIFIDVVVHRPFGSYTGKRGKGVEK